MVIAAGVAAAAASVGAAALSSSASSKAAKTQAKSSKKAADAQVQAAEIASRSQERIARESLAEQKRQYDQGRQDVAPWRDAGAQALSTLVSGFQPAGTYSAGGGWSGTQSDTIASGPYAGWTIKDLADGQVEVFDPSGQNGFTGSREGIERYGRTTVTTGTNAPLSGGEFNRPFTQADFAQDPGYAFRVSEGQKALERSAAARGGVLSGTHLKDITRWSQDLASQEYGNAYNRYQTDLTGRFNRLAAVSGTGQTGATTLASLGSQYAQGAATTLGQLGQNQFNAAITAGNARASGYTNAANANAAGIVGQANALNQGLGSISNAAQTYLLLNQLNRQPQSTIPAATASASQASYGWNTNPHIPQYY